MGEVKKDTDGTIWDLEQTVGYLKLVVEGIEKRKNRGDNSTGISEQNDSIDEGINNEQDPLYATREGTIIIPPGVLERLRREQNPRKYGRKEYELPLQINPSPDMPCIYDVPATRYDIPRGVTIIKTGGNEETMR